MRQRILAEPQLGNRVCVAVQREDAAGLERPAGEHVIDILAVPVAVQFDRHFQARGDLEYSVPVGRYPGTAVEDATSWMPEDCHPGRFDRGDHPWRLIVGLAQDR